MKKDRTKNDGRTHDSPGSTAARQQRVGAATATATDPKTTAF
jgi:hypothetical protein